MADAQDYVGKLNEELKQAQSTIDRLTEELQRVAKENKTLRNKVTMQRRLFEGGNISQIEALIDNFQNYARTQHNTISLEMVLCDLDSSAATHLRKFLEYLDTMRAELAAFVRNLPELLHPEILEIRHLIEDLRSMTDLLDVCDDKELKTILRETGTLHEKVKIMLTAKQAM